MIYFTNETGSCKTTVQFWQKVHGVDITHDNVCSSMLSCFYSHLLSTGRPISSYKFFFISRRALAREGDYEMMPVCACVRACVRALVSHADSSKTTTATDFL